MLCGKRNFNVKDICSQFGWLVAIFWFERCNFFISSFSSCIQAVYIQKPFQCNIYGLRELLIYLFSYFETFLSVGLMNLPFMSLTDMFNSLIWRSLRMTSLCKKNISPSKLYHLSKYSLTIFLR